MTMPGPPAATSIFPRRLSTAGKSAIISSIWSFAKPPFPTQACGGQASYSVELVKAVLELREQYPRWGKDKLVILLQHQGFDSSASMIGRVLRKLREQGLLQEPVSNHTSARKRRRQCPYAVGKPKGYQAKEPGDIVGNRYPGCQTPTKHNTETLHRQGYLIEAG